MKTKWRTLAAIASIVGLAIFLAASLDTDKARQGQIRGSGIGVFAASAWILSFGEKDEN